ncbi:MAG: methylenetetrahydrofolate reductase [NAD(P)H] [Lachnospiraceae bacterium]|nr:methylenetetrahydrofolate reductase [NAD(P)H] [Lachnospiraceae bacterium]MCM1230915.1 methylenetetrahydrofolate reductase [NAD(P)H] [Ruminococcus flavefaciens]
MKTCDLFREKTVLSFEVFPPKPDSDESVIYKTLDGLSGLQPDFISVTYGAGGGKNGSKTIKIASDVRKKYGIESVAHLPCINLTEKDTVEILDSLQENGIENILALRGDISADTKPCGRFSYASELIEFIHERYDFNIIAACYPEGHSESRNIAEDMKHLKHKVDCGVSQLITQLFLDNDDFYRFRERAEIIGIDVPVEAGIMPVTNKAQIERMVKLCGIKLPKKFMKMIERYENNPTALRDAGIAYAIDQIVDLIAQDVDGIHLYTMNNPYVAGKIYEAVYRLLAVKC